MSDIRAKSVSRRQFLKTTAATALVAGAGPAVIIPGRAQPKTLKIMRIVDFVPRYERWFTDYAASWGEENDTQVIIDWVKWDIVKDLQKQEIAAQEGHDMFDSGVLLFDHDQVIDHRDIYEECERQFGKPVDLVKQYAYDAKSDRFTRFVMEYLALPVIYRHDLWKAVGILPDTWNDVRIGGRQIKFLHESPLAISLFGYNDDTLASLRSLLLSFGASLQDAENRPSLKSQGALEALKFGKALFEESLPEESLDWNAASNNRFMLSGEGSLTLNAVSLTRTAENKEFPVANQLALARIPEGPKGRIGTWNGARRYAIWKFAKNIDGAKRFLVDYIGKSRDSLLASQYYFLPAFPEAVPDLKKLLSNDTSVTPPNKYQLLADAGDWTVADGYPGYNNRAVEEIYDSYLIAKMFVNAATGKMTPEEAMIQADQEVRKIYDKWRALGKV